MKGSLTGKTQDLLLNSQYGEITDGNVLWGNTTVFTTDQDLVAVNWTAKGVVTPV